MIHACIPGIEGQERDLLLTFDLSESLVVESVGSERDTDYNNVISREVVVSSVRNGTKV